MKQRAAFIKPVFFFLLALGFVVGGFVTYSFLQSPNKSVAMVDQHAGFSASVEGLASGVPITYEIISSADKPLSGTGVTGPAGTFKVPKYHLSFENPKPGSFINYNLEVKTSADPVRVSLDINPQTGKISISGSGLQKFSDVKLISGSSLIETKSDWAGLFREQAAAELNDLQNSEGLKIALYDNNILSDAGNNNPLVVKIFAAPGGGGPTATQVNAYTTSSCGNPRISVCRTGAMNGHTNRIRNNYLRALMSMTEQFSTVMMQQAASIGMFIDAKQQMETQRNLEALQAQAHKDYHPSEQMCRFGSYVRSIARADEKSMHDKQALNKILMATYTGSADVASSGGYATDITARINQFRMVYCDPADNNNGLKYMCDHDQNAGEPKGKGGAEDTKRINKDIDFPRTAESPLTLDIDFTDKKKTGDEEDIVALARNLYWPRALAHSTADDLPAKYAVYMDARRIFAINNVAHNSFAHITAMKGRSQPGKDVIGGGAYMKSMMREFGLSDEEIEKLLGEFPSYYAQMDVLTKKIYQSPGFYTNLYDKPANIDRIGVTMDAIQLMQGRDQFEASLRREMLLSMMIEEILSKNAKVLNDKIASEVVISR